MPFDSASNDAFPSLAVLGWDASRVGELAELSSTRGVELTPGRVARVDRGALTVLTGSAPLRVRPSGRLFGLDSTGPGEPIGTPAVGDWVALDGAVAVAVLSRRSTFERSSSDRATVAQVIAANIDTVFIVAPLVGRPRPRLVQRSLALAWQSGATPVVLLTKADIATDVSRRVADAEADAVGADVFPVSAASGEGLDPLVGYLRPGQTVGMIGPSGAGKSTLTNALGAGTFELQTGAVRDDGKGRHTTTARELVVLPTGAVAIDTPGLRGLALWDAEEGIGVAFADIVEYAADCRFADCAHHGEPGCAVGRAIAEGDLDAGRFDDYEKLQREQRRLETRRDSRARAQEHARAKVFYKAVRRQPHR
jgi:ribosome biogenesis GTPase / thiamine phosphate phosphatase